MALPKNTTTIEEFIEAGRGTKLAYFDLSFADKLSNGNWISVLNVVNDYMDELRNASPIVELTVEEQVKYYYKPKLLCSDVYGTPEIYFLILLINDMADVKEFTKPHIKMLRTDHLNEILSSIYNAERAAINKYNNKDIH